MSANYGTATLQAVYSSVTIQKVYTIAKSLAGAGGSPGAAGSATFLVTRAANDSSAPTNAEVTAVIGRNPVAGDICTVSYNNANNAVVYRYTTSWVTQSTYITGSLIVENTITSANLSTGSVTASKINVTNLSAVSSDMGTLTAGTIRLPGTGTTYMIVDGTNNRIDVYNAGVLRVRIGNLA